MKRLRLFVCFCTLVLTFGIVGQSAAALLGSGTYGTWGVIAGSTSFVNISITYDRDYVNVPSFSVFDAQAVYVSDVGTEFFVTSSTDNGFNDVVASFTNGIDDPVGFTVVFNPGGGFISDSIHEAALFGTSPDFQGYVIDKLGLKINSLSIENDPEEYGEGYTKVTYNVTLNVYGSVPIAIDIKPGSNPNSINLEAKGVIPVAILSTAGFDASTVDPTTVTFADAPSIKSKMVDVDYDGDMDMLLYFNIKDLSLDANSTEATLTGETYEGMDIQGTDSVSIVLKGNK